MLRLPWSKQGAVKPTPVVNVAPAKPPGPARKLSSVAYSNDEVLAVELCPALFRLAWVLVLTAHMLCGMFLLIFAATYWYLTDPIMGYYVHLWAPEKGNEHYDLYAMVFASIYALHWSRILTLIYRSMRECKLVFKRTRKPLVTLVEAIASKPSKGAVKSLKPQANAIKRENSVLEVYHSVGMLLRPARQAWGAVFGQEGLFGVESQHFLTVFILRELLELSTQTYQAYQFSHFLPRVWLNTMTVSMLLANCWSTLAVQHFLGNKPALERVVALSTDAAICVAMCVIVPCLLVAPYATAMDTASSSFKDPDQLYDPVFITSMVLEFQLTFASSLTDFAAKVIPHLAVYLSLVTIGELLDRSPAQSAAIAAEPARWVDDVSTNENVKEGKTASVERLASWKRQRSKHTDQAHKIVKLLLGLWGAVIVVLHTHAAIHSRLTFVEGCRAFTRPWLASRASCGSLVINCHARGVDSPDEGLLDAIDPTALAALTFTHCAGLRVPHAIQKFSNLMLLHVFNSTILDWGHGANAISATLHPRLLVAAIARTRFPLGFPEGLLQPLPASLLSIQFCVTDFTSLPDDLPTRWHPMAVVAFEFGALTEIPASLLSLQVFTLSLKGNKLETIPQLADMPPSFTVPELSLTENPLKELPDKLGSETTFIVRLDLQGTNLSALPAWTQTQVLKTNYVRGTPYCATVAPERQPANVQCGPRSVLDLNLDFPLDLIDEIYAIDRE
jgi:hypothetical protein